MADKNNNNAETDQGSPFLGHLFELRDRLMKSVLLILLVFAGLFSFAADLYTLVAQPLIAALPDGSTMIATRPASTFLTPFKLVLIASITICIPYLLYHLWAFIAPGLYKHERKIAFPLFFSSIFLFYFGMLFAYYLVFPLAFKFFFGFEVDGVTVAPDITESLNFMLKIVFAFGIAFEVPIATILLVVMGMTTPDSLVSKRPFIIVGAFVIAMLITPPDVISQVMLAFPMWLLFEIGVMFSRMILKMRKEREEEVLAEEAAEDRELSESEMDDEFEKAMAEEDALNEQPDNDAGSASSTKTNIDALTDDSSEPNADPDKPA